MIMNRRSPVRAASLALAGVATLAVLLTGCGGDAPEAGADPSAPASDTSQGQAPESTNAPSTPASSAPAESDDSDDSGDSDDAGKPSKEDVVEGLMKFYQDTQGLSKDKAEKFATCMVDQMYDKASAKTLNAMRDGDPSKLDKADAELLGQAGATCGSVLE